MWSLRWGWKAGVEQMPCRKVLGSSHCCCLSAARAINKDRRNFFDPPASCQEKSLQSTQHSVTLGRYPEVQARPCSCPHESPTSLVSALTARSPGMVGAVREATVGSVTAESEPVLTGEASPGCWQMGGKGCRVSHQVCPAIALQGSRRAHV